ncbi:MBL fold metallo-hydrolase [Paenibacillus psychroresistens]|uniref:MBL fold metallo-hydrolase n=1 Tax=Paenibacillus psychroresistens TaxID=1778678 RepID=A0A6B8RR46_9BACL|nr:MBL fold metallo-hydrolase [Paenibacillus psychroresistens]QGQ98327.1 MBL fold metallo-hydrolase [Paenibacillus psychroresistens]
MKITVLGPWGAYPKAGEATAGYLLEHEDEKILIDCGSGVLAQLQKHIQLSEVTAVIISHTHFDHIADLGCLQYACLIDTDLGNRTSILPIYMADESNNNQYKAMSGTEIRRIAVGEALSINELQFSFFQTFHGVYCLAVKLEFANRTFVYTADTFYDDSLVQFCANADVVIAETSFYKSFEAKKYGHMNTTDVGTLALKANIGKVYLTHLPHFGEQASLADEVGEIYPGPIALAYCGMEIVME